eukprot:gene14794-21343_t
MGWDPAAPCCGGDMTAFQTANFRVINIDARKPLLHDL